MRRFVSSVESFSFLLWLMFFVGRLTSGVALFFKIKWKWAGGGGRILMLLCVVTNGILNVLYLLKSTLTWSCPHPQGGAEPFPCSVASTPEAQLLKVGTWSNLVIIFLSVKIRNLFLRYESLWSLWESYEVKTRLISEPGGSHILVSLRTPFVFSCI